MPRFPDVSAIVNDFEAAEAGDDVCLCNLVVGDLYQRPLCSSRKAYTPQEENVIQLPLRLKATLLHAEAHMVSSYRMKGEAFACRHHLR